VVVLVRPRNPLNIGAAARAMSNFGARHLRLVNPYAAGFREARSAVGASALLNNALEFDSVAEAVADCSLVVGTTAVRNRALHSNSITIRQGRAVVRLREDRIDERRFYPLSLAPHYSDA
jgi:tRNA C32,U32 (ribose-2'-O)-methylase TrmJ